MTEAQPPQDNTSEKRKLAVGKNAGSRVLGVMPPLSREEMRQLFDESAQQPIAVIKHPDGSQSLSFEALDFGFSPSGNDPAFLSFVDGVAERLRCAKQEREGQHVPRVAHGSLFEQQLDLESGQADSIAEESVDNVVPLRQKEQDVHPAAIEAPQNPDQIIQDGSVN